MKKVFLVLTSLTSYVLAQTIVVQPYLQDAEPTSMAIMWETDSDNATSVEYGLTAALGTLASGTAVTGNGSSQIHTVVLSGLTPGTRYYYKAITGTTESAIYQFNTPALPSAESNTSIVAMSDMQQHATHPNVFYNVIHDGVIKYMTDSVPGDLPDNLQMVIIPGDLVDNGTIYSQWETTYFDPAADLFSYVPSYPAIGNHEQGNISYFKYHTLPDNGTAGYEEQWWYKDHSNVRIIGLNSNFPYTILPAQLTWLDGVLSDTAADTSIDFVFAELHHPFHSELWIAGNTNFTGDVITRLENFSTTSGKPSIHFFGHTHGYSHGNSRDHNHLMINVASAGGAIDNWGEFAQQDYPEYLMSQDTYGWVYVTVQAGSNPQFTIKRFGMGQEGNMQPNALEDIMTIKKNNNTPLTPIGLFPATNDIVIPECVILKGNNFLDADNDGHHASHWQVSTSCSDFSAPVVDSWKQHMNWYFNVDLQAADDLTDEAVTTLNTSTDYCWRVRYRDKSLAWSDWSTPIPFSTGPSSETGNLLVNPGAENGTINWTATAGVLESLLDGECAGTSPYAGTKYFAVGAVCVENAFGSAEQMVDVSSYATQIDQGTVIAKFGGYLRDYNGSDIPAFAAQFYDATNALLSSSDTTSEMNASWVLKQNSWAVPAGTRFIKYIMMGTRTSGTDNDSYLDELYLRLNLNGDSCSQYNPAAGVENITTLQELKVYPNPVTTSAIINIPNTNGEHLKAKIFNTSGQVVKEMHHLHGPTFTINRGEMANGLYILMIYNNNDQRIGYAKVIFN